MHIRVNFGCHQTAFFENKPRKGKEKETAEEGRDGINHEKLVEKGIWLVTYKQKQNEGRQAYEGNYEPQKSVRPGSCMNSLMSSLEKPGITHDSQVGSQR